MPIPTTLSDIALRLYDQLSPLAFDDPNRSYALAHLCEAFIGSLDAVEFYARNYDATVTKEVVPGKFIEVEVEKIGWSKLFDLDLIPDNAVPWLAQFVGVSDPRYAGEDDAAYAARLKPLIVNPIGFYRGTPGSIRSRVRDTLTGTKTVYLVERQGSAYTMAVSTWASETPNPTVTAAAARSQKPAGIVMNVSTLTGGDFQTLRDTHVDFNDINTPVTTFLAIRTNPSL